MTEAMLTIRKTPCDSESNTDSLRIENEKLKIENAKLKRAVESLKQMAAAARGQLQRGERELANLNL